MVIIIIFIILHCKNCKWFFIRHFGNYRSRWKLGVVHAKSYIFHKYQEVPPLALLILKINILRLGLLLALNHDNVLFYVGLLPCPAKQTIEISLILISELQIPSVLTCIRYIVLSSDIMKKNTSGSNTITSKIQTKITEQLRHVKKMLTLI